MNICNPPFFIERDLSSKEMNGLVAECQRQTGQVEKYCGMNQHIVAFGLFMKFADINKNPLKLKHALAKMWG